eukprot:scaffold71349_cov15-Prasinocladus_malaysianus.AAC.3
MFPYLACMPTGLQGVKYEECVAKKTRNTRAILREVGSSSSTNLVTAIVWNNLWAPYVEKHKSLLPLAGEKLRSNPKFFDEAAKEQEKNGQNIQAFAPFFMMVDPARFQRDRYWYAANKY